MSDSLQAQLSAWQCFYQTCLQYQKTVHTPLGLSQKSTHGTDVPSLVKEVWIYMTALLALIAVDTLLAYFIALKTKDSA